MTLRRAQTLLLDAAANELQGTGVGLRPQINQKQREELRAAWNRVYQAVYGFPADDHARFNKGIT